MNDAHKKMCKAIFKSDNVEKTVLDVLASSNPDDVVMAATKIVQAETKAICKRNSGSLLLKKDHDSMMTFTWNKFHKDLEVRAPNLLRVISAVVSDVPVAPSEKKFMNILHTIATGCHGRSQEMSGLHYCIAFLLVHGGCTQRDIQRLAKIGLCVSPGSVHNKLASWIDKLDEDVIQLKKDWSEGGNVKYQLVGDNWDKNILPAFRTSQQKTLSLHLFNVVVVVDRIIPTARGVENSDELKTDIKLETFIPSIEEQTILMDELVFHFATSVIKGVPQMKAEFANIYPAHLTHPYSAQAGEKTKQYPLGLFDTNETKTADMIQLLRDLQSKYVPLQDDHIVESVFFGGDRLTDERVQCAQQSVLNGETAESRLEGFISKIEDFHRLMNFLEAICRLTYSTDSGGDRGTACYFRNLLDARNVKGDVKNAYRPYKLLYYTILDAMCIVLFFKKFNRNADEEIPLPIDFEKFSSNDKISWLNGISREILQEYFFESQNDIMHDLREIITDISHPENYYLSNLENDRVQYHFCPKSYAYVGSLKAHEEKVHGAKTPISKPSNEKVKDELGDHCRLLFKLALLHKNLDSAVDMADGHRSVRSAKYELPIYVKTNKTKYAIGSIHLVSLTEGVLNGEQKERLIANRCVNLQGGKNNNMALDEYVELLNRDSKVVCSGFQTKESILRHSKEFPHIVNFVKHFDSVCNVTTRKGFHHLPSYAEDVQKIVTQLFDIDAFTFVEGRKLKCKSLCTNKNIFNDCFKGFATLVHRHKPLVAFHRLGNKHI
ncbi:uncharacterized protein LOC125649436 [Ostrea edulis]|uniref:uncharacterized protein LOC125649436 n=1 Tax=Ostrea edulis TaxID=37623 RepID=UPI0024AF6CD0|nr:uncharacterized protein LOC125649436 [Ostrea edulis]XP_056014423.1 uncharacterized protein LOC125649436 [Ostrea edulis]